MSPIKMLLTEREAAEFIGLTPRFLQQRRYRGEPPRFVRISSRCIRYRMEDIQEWLAENLRTSTTETSYDDWSR